MLKDFITRFKNARKVVHQIRAGEWTPRYNPLSREHLVAEREDLELWVGNGPFHCEVSGHDCFGLLWRHYVWWAAANKLKKDADKAVKEGPLVL